MRLPTALVVEPAESAGAGRLGDWLRDAGLLLDSRAPAAGPLPDLGSYAALVVMGGPMGAYDDEAHPWLSGVRDLLRTAVAGQVPTLGICLGGQLLAGALGGQVRPADEGPEIGPALVAKRDVAAADRLFGPVPFTPDVLQWHYDVITRLPAGATLLASSVRYEVQAFRVGEMAWGTQFHVETTPDQVRRWAAEDAALLAGEGWDVEAALARWDLETVHADLEEVWQPVAQRFAELAREREYARR
jgi:GMP synthase-like glutamine amidotransferase